MPRPTQAQLGRLYDQDYFEGFAEGAGIAGGNQEVSPSLKARLKTLEQRMPRGRLLDLGCGLGHFVAHAHLRGWEAVGVEPSNWAAEQGRRRYGVTIHACPLEDVPIAPASVDVIHANHAVEHLIDPVATLETARRLLRPGGLLVAEVPQELTAPLTDRLFARLHPELYSAPRPSVTHHLVFFSPRGIEATASRAGFAVERLETVRHVRSSESRLPFGVSIKKAMFWMEGKLKTAPNIVIVARRP